MPLHSTSWSFCSTFYNSHHDKRILHMLPIRACYVRLKLIIMLIKWGCPQLTLTLSVPAPNSNPYRRRPPPVDYSNSCNLPSQGRGMDPSYKVLATCNDLQKASRYIRTYTYTVLVYTPSWYTHRLGIHNVLVYTPSWYTHRLCPGMQGCIYYQVLVYHIKSGMDWP